MNRRDFLAGATAAFLAGPMGLRAAAGGRRLKAGFLGGSHSHATEKWRLVRASADYELVGMSEPSAGIRAGYEKSGAVFLDADALIEASEVVFVESGVAEHARDATRALAAGRHVHVEKPPSDNLPDFEAMVRLAREKRLVMQLGYMWRYHPGFRAIFDAVRAGWLGEVYSVRGMIGNQLAADQRPAWAEFAGGGMFELGAHLIDATIRLLGEPISVTPLLRKHGRFADDLKDNNVAVFEFGRASAVIFNSTLQPNAGRQRVFEVFGTNGSATLQPIEPPVLRIELAKPAGPYRAGANAVALPAYARYAADIADLAAVVRGERSLPVTLDEELRVHRWLLRASGMR